MMLVQAERFGTHIARSSLWRFRVCPICLPTPFFARELRS